tara:strand:+ start:198 stop:443 length:246 start_codon:yes stop_codon:yes gene_type:complete
MKNNLIVGIFIGIGMIVIPLILMGTTYSNISNESGSYQVSTTGLGSKNNVFIYETIIDSKTGKIISRERIHYLKYKKNKLK